MTDKTLLRPGDPFPGLLVNLPGGRSVHLPGDLAGADSRRPMAPLPYDQDITSWPQLLRAIEDAEAGQGTARLTEICRGGTRVRLGLDWGVAGGRARLCQ